MRRLAILFALGLVLVPAAQASRLPYRTETQARYYLEHTLKTWAGVDLTRKKYKFRVAFCLPGARSNYEKTHRHFTVRENGKGEHVYHTFACALAAANKIWHLYVVALPHGKYGLRNDKQPPSRGSKP
jgi:DNA-dependent RNA polymerase auxiliary subunit epsilon